MPRDIDGTLDTIISGKVLRVGLATSDPRVDDENRALVARLISDLEHRTGARAQISRDGTEPLLLDLEAGDLDLVIGSFGTKSPWKTRVSFAPALAGKARGDATIELKAAARNGENRWIGLIERESRSVAKQGGSE